MRVGVTGAAGYLGSNLVLQLLDAGLEVTAFDLQPLPQLQHPKLTWKSFSLLDSAATQQALVGLDLIYHIAGKITLQPVDELAWRVNVDGTRHVAQAALAQGAKMVLCSSLAAFDHCRHHFIDETAPRSIDPSLPVYDRSKYHAEVVLREFIDQGLVAAVGNPTAIFGPVDYLNSRANQLLLSAAKGRMLAAPGGGFNFVDVRDVAQGLQQIAAGGRTGENYILGGYHASSFEIVQLAAAAAKARIKPKFEVPKFVLQALVPLATLQAKLTKSEQVLTMRTIEELTNGPQVSWQKAATELGYQPRPLAESAADLIAFYRDQGML